MHRRHRAGPSNSVCVPAPYHLLEYIKHEKKHLLYSGAQPILYPIYPIINSWKISFVQTVPNKPDKRHRDRQTHVSTIATICYIGDDGPDIYFIECREKFFPNVFFAKPARMTNLHVSTITFIQALGILVLAKILFGGFRGGWGSGRYYWKQRMRDKWNNMTPEQRDKFKQEWQKRCGHWGYKSWYDTASSHQPESSSESRVQSSEL